VTREYWLLACLVLGFCGCAASRPRLKTVERLEIARFMGRWYVIACIPTFMEKQTYNAVETYTVLPDGAIDTVFTFRKGGFDGPRKRYNPRGFVVDKVHNSTWGMRFVWPVKAEYLITHLSADYSVTVISRNKRDYVWIMARTPEIPDAEYQKLLAEIAAQGYDLKKMRKIPQRWPEKD
jgi:apolipoprotein D and lipocalin family protein